MKLCEPRCSGTKNRTQRQQAGQREATVYSANIVLTSQRLCSDAAVTPLTAGISLSSHRRNLRSGCFFTHMAGGEREERRRGGTRALLTCRDRKRQKQEVKGLTAAINYSRFTLSPVCRELLRTPPSTICPLAPAIKMFCVRLTTLLLSFEATLEMRGCCSTKTHTEKKQKKKQATTAKKWAGALK